MNTDNNKHIEVTEKIIKAFNKVYNSLGYGFLEKVYENALFIEFTEMNLNVEKQKKINVYYEGKEVGEYFSDLIVDGQVIIELKTAEYLNKANEFQLINYLKATGIDIGILLNFGKKPEFKRRVYSSDKDLYKNIRWNSDIAY